VRGLSVIQIQNLTKYYGKTLALDSVNLEVEQGEVFGFIGPNGAGKTTTLRILLGLLRKNAGKVSVLGGDPWRDAVALHRRLAYVPGDVNLWPSLSGGEVIDLLAGGQGVFGIAVGRVWQEVEGSLAQLPGERSLSVEEIAQGNDELAARRRARAIGE